MLSISPNLSPLLGIWSDISVIIRTTMETNDIVSKHLYKISNQLHNQ